MANVTHMINPFASVNDLQKQLTEQRAIRETLLRSLKQSNWGDAQHQLRLAQQSRISTLDEVVSIQYLQKQLKALEEVSKLEVGYAQKLREAQRQKDEWESALKELQGYADDSNALHKELNNTLQDIQTVNRRLHQARKAAELHSVHQQTRVPASSKHSATSLKELVEHFVKFPVTDKQTLNNLLKTTLNNLKHDSYDQLAQTLLNIVLHRWFEQARVLDTRLSHYEKLFPRNSKNAVVAASQEVNQVFHSLDAWANIVDAAVLVPFKPRYEQVFQYWKNKPTTSLEFILKKEAYIRKKSQDGFKMLKAIAPTANLKIDEFQSGGQDD